MNPNWRPDWRDPKKYPDPAKTRLVQWAWEFLRRNEKYQQRCSQLQDLKGPISVFQEEFGIILPVPPNQTSPPEFLHHAVSGRDRPALKYCPEEKPYNVTLSLTPGESLIVFNLGWPIDIQLERARAWLKGRAVYLRELGDLKTIKSTNHVLKFREYLRILDAHSAGASQREMAAVIFPRLPNEYPERRGEDAVRHALKRAKYLRDVGYRFVAA